MHFKLRKQHIFFILIALLSLLCVLLTACSQEKEQLTATAPQQIYTPAPSHSPQIDTREKVTLNGAEVDCYSDPLSPGTRYVLLRDVMDAIESTYIYDSTLKQWQFYWRDQPCTLTRDSNILTYGDKEIELAEAPFVCRVTLKEEPAVIVDEANNYLYYGDERYSLDDAPQKYLDKVNHGAHNVDDQNRIVVTPEPYAASDYLFIPIESFCEGLEMGSLYDSANNMLYISPGAGNWTLAEGYSVPVIMHYATGEQWHTDMRYRELDDIEKEFQYLSANGYTFIWFEDLWNVENIEKPVIMTFDDGFKSNYDYLMPLAVKYNAKVTEFIVPGNMDSNLTTSSQVYMSTDEIKEFYETGLLSIQCHTMNEDYDILSLTGTAMENEVVNCKLFITRLTGQVPFVFAYPYGEQYQDKPGVYNDEMLSLVKANYRFAVTSADTLSYTTGNNPYTIPRLYLGFYDDQENFVYYMEHGRLPEE